jgi:hypothetical protein
MWVPCCASDSLIRPQRPGVFIPAIPGASGREAEGSWQPTRPSSLLPAAPACLKEEHVILSASDQRRIPTLPQQRCPRANAKGESPPLLTIFRSSAVFPRGFPLSSSVNSPTLARFSKAASRSTLIFRRRPLPRCRSFDNNAFRNALARPQYDMGTRAIPRHLHAVSQIFADGA